METPAYNPIAPFCTTRKAFLFASEKEARSFQILFDALLLLEREITRDSEGNYLVGIEELVDNYSGE